MVVKKLAGVDLNEVRPDEVQISMICRLLFGWLMCACYKVSSASKKEEAARHRTAVVRNSRFPLKKKRESLVLSCCPAESNLLILDIDFSEVPFPSLGRA